MPEKNKNNSGSLRELVFGRGFYAALVICLIAAALAVLASVGRNADTQSVDAVVTSQSAGTLGSTESASVKSTTSAENTTSSTGESTSYKAQPPSEQVIDTQVPYESYYVNPVKGTIIKYFSTELTFSDTMNDYRTHNGVDYLANSRDAVYAINKGTVTAVYEDQMLGSVIEINHGHDVLARYCGVETQLKAGDEVSIGQEIGVVLMIPFEALDDTHLHLEIIYRGKFVDPLELMSKVNEEDD